VLMHCYLATVEAEGAAHRRLRELRKIAGGEGLGCVTLCPAANRSGARRENDQPASWKTDESYSQGVNKSLMKLFNSSLFPCIQEIVIVFT